MVVKSRAGKPPRKAGKPAIKPTGGKVKSIAALKDSLRRSNGGGGVFFRVPNEELLVRFLTEPTEWWEVFEHYDEPGKRYFGCAQEDCPGCDDDMRQTKRMAANVLNVNSNAVVPLLMPMSLASDAMKKYERWKTITDRDYFIKKSGQGLETEYEIDSGPDKPRNVKRFMRDMHDLGALSIQHTLEGRQDTSSDPDVEDDDYDEDEDLDDDYEDDDVEEEIERAMPRRRPVKASQPKRRRVQEDYDDEEEDDEPPARTRKVKKAVPAKSVRKPAPKTAVRKLRRG